MTSVVIVSAVRTAVGKFGGGLAGQSAVNLGAIVIREALARARRIRACRRGHHGPGARRRLRPESARQASLGADCRARAGHDHQQGLRLRVEGRCSGCAGDRAGDAEVIVAGARKT